jgi:V/A-type H+/Na+-transporting ATPase subunit E
MGLETVKEEIIRSAKAEEKAILAGAKKESNKIKNDTEKKIEEYEKLSEKEADREIEVIKGQFHATAELENRKQILEAKKQVIEEVFSAVKKNLSSLDNKTRESYLKTLIAKAKRELKVSFVYCNASDAGFFKEFETQASDMIGGLKAENKEKTIRVDYSYETILESIQESELAEINRILFS